MMKLVIGADHAAFTAKETLKKQLGEDLQIVDLGTFSEDRCDYPDIAAKVAQAVAKGEAERGILLCGTGIGMSIAANRIPKVRAALCFNEETVRLSREHNDSNVLCMGGRLLPPEQIVALAKLWLNTPFSGGRHQKRIDKIDGIVSAIPNLDKSTQV